MIALPIRIYKTVYEIVHAENFCAAFKEIERPRRTVFIENACNNIAYFLTLYNMKTPVMNATPKTINFDNYLIEIKKLTSKFKKELIYEEDNKKFVLNHLRNIHIALEQIKTGRMALDIFYFYKDILVASNFTTHSLILVEYKWSQNLFREIRNEMKALSKKVDYVPTNLNVLKHKVILPEVYIQKVNWLFHVLIQRSSITSDFFNDNIINLQLIRNCLITLKYATIQKLSERK